MRHQAITETLIFMFDMREHAVYSQHSAFHPKARGLSGHRISHHLLYETMNRKALILSVAAEKRKATGIMNHLFSFQRIRDYMSKVVAQIPDSATEELFRDQIGCEERAKAYKVCSSRIDGKQLLVSEGEGGGNRCVVGFAERASSLS